MEVSKENMFKVGYTSVLGENTVETKKWTSSLKRILNKNKLITGTVIIFGICVILNCILIFNFIRILENM